MKEKDITAIYQTTKWRRKREQILKRDKYQCTICKRYGKMRQAAVVHHIKPLQEYPELAWDDDNLTSLCRKCHEMVHPEKGGKHWK